jgi:5-methylcytosine-specific restriction endonuclease McrA
VLRRLLIGIRNFDQESRHSLMISSMTIVLAGCDTARWDGRREAAPYRPVLGSEIEVILKRCGTCAAIKSESEFNFRSREKGTIHSTCRECQRAMKAAHYERNKASYKARSALSKKRLVDRNKFYVYQYLLGKQCVDCGENDIAVLEFDHVRQEKFMSISQMVQNAFAIEKISEEIQKCEVRCSNCHRKKTARERGWRLPYLDGEFSVPSSFW